MPARRLSAPKVPVSHSDAGVGTDDAAAYRASPPTKGEFDDEEDPLGWEGEGWEEFTRERMRQRFTQSRPRRRSVRRGLRNAAHPE